MAIDPTDITKVTGGPQYRAPAIDTLGQGSLEQILPAVMGSMPLATAGMTTTPAPAVNPLHLFLQHMQQAGHPAGAAAGLGDPRGIMSGSNAAQGWGNFGMGIPPGFLSFLSQLITPQGSATTPGATGGQLPTYGGQVAYGQTGINTVGSTAPAATPGIATAPTATATPPTSQGLPMIGIGGGSGLTL